MSTPVPPSATSDDVKHKDDAVRVLTRYATLLTEQNNLLKDLAESDRRHAARMELGFIVVVCTMIGLMVDVVQFTKSRK
jgi:hypothetical protein